MASSSDRARYKELRREIEHHNELYYEQAEPEISDAQYDELYRELVELEKKHPDWVDEESPTRKVGGRPSKKFETVEHRLPMLSLANTYNEQEVHEFHQRVVRELGDEERVRYTCEPKFDGIAVALHYDRGRYVLGVTRGDGRTGENITDNLATLDDLPAQLPDGPWNEARIELRGEAVMPLSAFRELNEQRTEQGQEPFANPRNSTAGSLKLLDAREVARRPLTLRAYELIVHEGEQAWAGSRHSERLARIKEMGLPVAEHELVRDGEGMQKFWQRLADERSELPIEVDGVVVKLDDLKLRDELGTTAKSPRWAMAYKFAAQRATTRLKKITHQVGRTGAVTPVAELEAVQLAGSTIRRATLHNTDEIHRLGLGEDMEVVLEKAGDVIPKVVARAEGEPEGSYQPPKNCPACGEELVQPPDEVIRRCVNISCPAMLRGRLIHFASRGAMDIEGLGEKTVDLLMEQELFSDPGDIYALELEPLRELPGFAELSAKNLVQAIEQSKDRPLDRVLFALGIRMVGAGVARVLARHYKGLDALASAAEEPQAMEQLDEVGPKIAASIAEFFGLERNLAFVEKLRQAGVNFGGKDEGPGEQEQTLHGMRIVLTGSLEQLTREELAQLLRERGANVTSSVSKKTDLLIVGTDAGSKLDKARGHGVEILEATSLSGEQILRKLEERGTGE